MLALTGPVRSIYQVNLVTDIFTTGMQLLHFQLDIIWTIETVREQYWRQVEIRKTATKEASQSVLCQILDPFSARTVVELWVRAMSMVRSHILRGYSENLGKFQLMDVYSIFVCYGYALGGRYNRHYTYTTPPLPWSVATNYVSCWDFKHFPLSNRWQIYRPLCGVPSDIQVACLDSSESYLCLSKIGGRIIRLIISGTANDYCK